MHIKVADCNESDIDIGRQRHKLLRYKGSCMTTRLTVRSSSPDGLLFRSSGYRRRRSTQPVVAIAKGTISVGSGINGKI
ncbi:MAG: hypothetical protein KatS3mg104_1172 [Phycisphaerae bacterium]|nr:MAG: hypothetical protein KatS3mg104_1172 [Phycisphaerae bacterium]